MASITIDEAARYLNVSTRTISTYISQGILSYHKKQGNNRKYIDTNELHDFKLAKESGEFSTKKFKELQCRVRKLEAQIDVLMRILDTKQMPLGLSTEEVVELHDTAYSCSHAALSIEYAEAWLPILMRIDENDFSSIEQGLKTDKPWAPFLDLCIGLIVTVSTDKQYGSSLKLQSMHKELAEARRRIRLSALLYIEGRGPKQEVDHLVIRPPDTTVELLKKTIKKQV